MSPAQRHRQVAALHAAAIDQGFLATLGEPFLAQVYRAIDEAADSVLLVEELDGRVVGFVAGGSGMATIYRRMLRHPLQLAFSLASVFAQPSRLLRMMDIVRYGRASDAGLVLPRAELLSVAVDPACRGTGLAVRLYEGLEEHFARRGINAFRITVGESLAAAHRFYQRMGAKPMGRIEVHAGRGSVVYVQEVPIPRGAGGVDRRGRVRLTGDDAVSPGQAT